MKEFIENWGLLITLLGLIGVEISPIKVNPLSWIGKHIGRFINGELSEKVEHISNKVNSLERAADFKEISDIKLALTTLQSNLVEYGLTEDQYRRCFELEDKYRYYQHKYNTKEKVVNGHMDAIFELIEENYKKGNIIKVGGKNEKYDTSAINSVRK